MRRLRSETRPILLPEKAFFYKLPAVSPDTAVFFYQKGVFYLINENKIRILYVQPGKYPEERLVANELHPLQRLVGGYMQAVYPWSKDKVALVCNDSGKVDGLPLNRCIEDYDVIAGNFFICGFSGEEFCSLTDKQFRYYEKLFRDPELFLPTPIGIMPMKCTPDQYKRLMQERNTANRGER